MNNSKEFSFSLLCEHLQITHATIERKAKAHSRWIYAFSLLFIAPLPFLLGTFSPGEEILSAILMIAMSASTLALFGQISISLSTSLTVLFQYGAFFFADREAMDAPLMLATALPIAEMIVVIVAISAFCFFGAMLLLFSKKAF